MVKYSKISKNDNRTNRKYDKFRKRERNDDSDSYNDDKYNENLYDDFDDDYEDYEDYEEEIKHNIKTLDDLIRLGKTYRKKRKYEYRKLYDIRHELKDLNNLIGMKSIKETVVGQILFYIQDLGCNDMLHTAIAGKSGSGKTELAKILAKIYLKLGFLENNKFIIAKRSDLIGKYLGQTAPKTQEVIDKSSGGVLFIDEAYSLGNKHGRDMYSKECIDTIVSNLAEKRDFVLIIAGYEEELQKCFFDVNQGLDRRFPWRFSIDKYTIGELAEIFIKQTKECGWKICNEEMVKEYFKKDNKSKYFGKQGGDTEIFLAKCKIEHSKRVFGLSRYKKMVLVEEDLINGFELFKKNKVIIENKIPEWMYL